jgi:D-alanyl-D-alanine carboxypeptidase (penicillin-binding protein 5/6)
MKKIASMVLAVVSFGFVAAGARFYAKNGLKTAKAVAEAVTMDEKPAKDVLDISAKAAYLMDNYSKTAIYSHQEEERLPIASMCKIMTLLLSFDAIRAGNLSFDEEIMVSERAASMGGSQVFLEANAKYLVKELIKSVVICSANDSCVALAERIAGSEQIFVDRMNEKAKEIGANNTLFANCTGLPKEPQYSCAKDVALMLSKLLENEEYYGFGKVWMDKFEHPEGRYTEITNTNKLIRFYDGCDGGKTGFTNEAGFCLAATAKRDNTRIISVVIGEKDSKQRFEDVRTMFDYAFANYTTKKIVQADVPLGERARVDGGKSTSIAVAPQRDAYLFLRRGMQGDITS